MQLLWTKSNMPLSKVIRYLTGEDCSHFAVLFDSLGLVLQSNLVGVHLSIANEFLDGVEILHAVHFDVESLADQKRVEADVCLEVMQKIAGKNYGFRALIYFGWREFLKKFFGKVLPERNSWADSREFLCTSIYDELPDDVVPVIPALDYASMVTPHMLYQSVVALSPHAGNV